MEPRGYEDPTAPQPRTRTDHVAVDVDVARPSAAAPFLGIAGLILAVSAFLNWAKDANESARAEDSSIAGYAVSDGRIVLGIGIALLLMALYMATSRRAGHWFDSDLLGLALSTIALTVAVATWLAIPDEVSADIGLYVAMLGGLIGLVGSLLALLAGRRDRDGVVASRTGRT